MDQSCSNRKSFTLSDRLGKFFYLAPLAGLGFAVALLNEFEQNLLCLQNMRLHE